MAIPVDEMPGLASEAELAALREASGEAADALFVALMQDHHRAGVAMAEAAAERASDPWVRELAERMARNHAIEINEMDAARRCTGLVDDPDGYQPGPLGHGTDDGVTRSDGGMDEMDHSEG